MMLEMVFYSQGGTMEALVEASNWKILCCLINSMRDSRMASINT